MPDKTRMGFAYSSFAFAAGLFLTISAFGYVFRDMSKFESDPGTGTGNITEIDEKNRSEVLLRIKQKALLARGYIKDNGFNAGYCFLLDMRIPSGKRRFFVYNLEKDSVEMGGLVTHGSGSENGTGELFFSNTPNSNCTSLGKYKIGKSYLGNFGLAYKLYGLDNSNSKAFERFVVLHAYGCVPDDEVSPFSICLSLGCPTVSPAFFARLKTYMDRSTGPVLLWIYY